MLSAGISIPETFDENELMWILNVAGPIEPQIAWFLASGLSEGAYAIDPLVTAFWANVELHND